MKTMYLLHQPLGESAVGKSSLVLRFVKGQFQEYQESTIGGKILYYPSLSFSRKLLYSSHFTHYRL